MKRYVWLVAAVVIAVMGVLIGKMLRLSYPTIITLAAVPAFLVLFPLGEISKPETTLWRVASRCRCIYCCRLGDLSWRYALRRLERMIRHISERRVLARRSFFVRRNSAVRTSERFYQGATFADCGASKRTVRGSSSLCPLASLLRPVAHPESAQAIHLSSHREGHSLALRAHCGRGRPRSQRQMSSTALSICARCSLPL
jgi:hypothetical protein